MSDFKGKVSVITGGASGIGFSLAKRCLAEGMHTIICDIDENALAEAAKQLASGSGSLQTEKLDVQDANAVQALAEKVNAEFGSTHLLFNNAGVGGGGKLWEQSLEDWNWVLGINLMGVVHCIKAFVPAMVKADAGHIVNTASIAGLMSAPGTSTYSVSKHGVVAISEVMFGDLRNDESKVGVSVLCPSFVNTRIYESDRNRPNLSEEKQAELKAAAEFASGFFAEALSPDAVADLVFDAIANKQFYILPHPKGSKVKIKQRMEQILNDKSPTVTGAEEFPFE